MFVRYNLVASCVTRLSPSAAQVPVLNLSHFCRLPEIATSILISKTILINLRSSSTISSPLDQRSYILKMTIDCDVVVVGAGPIGLTTALLLRQFGHSVRLFERHSMRYPTARAVGLFHQGVTNVTTGSTPREHVTSRIGRNEWYEWYNGAPVPLGPLHHSELPHWETPQDYIDRLPPPS
jgi:FAD binding domain